VNSAAEGEGWFFKLRLSDISELEGLMEADAYKAFATASDLAPALPPFVSSDLETLGRAAPRPFFSTALEANGPSVPPPFHESIRMRYLPLADADRQAMLRAVGVASIDDLFLDVPEAARLAGKIEGLADHATELSVERQLGTLARQNLVAGKVPFFLGCGAYKHHIPASVDHLIQRGEFLTSYTPYQPEIAQGTLQACSSSRRRLRAFMAATSPTPPCTMAPPPAGRLSRWRGASRGAAKPSSRRAFIRTMYQ
jgi:hypothetical protein